jgi:hypothetical protein
MHEGFSVGGRKMSTQNNATTVATINNVNIVVMEDGKMPFVPIKPICDALGIHFSTQLAKLKDDEFYSSTVALSTTVGADKKSREMASLPLQEALLWLGSINPKNVAPEAKDSVMRYKKACAQAIYSHFFGYMAFERQRKTAISKINEAKKEQRRMFREAKSELKKLQEQLDFTLDMTFEEYTEGQKQLPIEFPE